MVLNLAIRNKNPSKVESVTRDIDGDWVGERIGGSMKKIVKKTIIILLLLTLSTSTAFLAYLHFFASDEENLSGEWITNLDMTERTKVIALSWLQDIEGVSISLEDMDSYMQDLTIQVNLKLEQTTHSGGDFYCNVLPESYDACNQAAYEAFAAVFQMLLGERLRMAGYTGSTDKEAMDALVIETFGMPAVSYLMSCGPALLPSLEELQDQYDGSGTYEAAEGILTRQFDAGGAAAAKEERYIWEEDDLVLLEEVNPADQYPSSDNYPVRYTLK